MKPRNREINIFNMSLLDVLCGALGAFCFLMLALFPYYAKGSGSAAQNQEDVAKLKQELEQARKELEQAKSKAQKSGESPEQLANENQELQKKLAEARQQLEKAAAKKPADEKKPEESVKKIADSARSVLWVTAFWDRPNADVDLWIKYESGVWEGPKRETPDGKKLVHQFPDTQQGPGFETFIDTGAGGRYEVYYKTTGRGGQPMSLPVNMQVTWLTITEKGYRYSHQRGQNTFNADGRLTPAWAISFAKGELQMTPLGAQR